MEIILSFALQFATYVLSSIGFWLIFKKCGVKPIYSLIPFVRDYQLSLCADKEKDGRAFTIISGIYLILDIVYAFFESGSTEQKLMSIALFALVLARYLYAVRIYLGLTQMFGRKKKWVLAFFFFESVTLILWGASSKFQPKKKVVDLKKLKGADVSNSDVEIAAEGLTINIEERTAIDFFKKKTLLKDIHMVIPKGHMVLLLGGSGAGKTTFVNAVTGYEKAKADIELDGHNIYTEYSKMMYDIGFVPQQDLMRGNDTAQLTLNDAASLRLPSSVPFSEKKKRVAAVLDQFGLTAVKNNLVEKLSGGQRKRLSIAMEFISDPTIFFLDEPDSGLDGVVARSLFEKLRAIADQGKIIVVITHTPDRVIDLFDDVIVLAKDSTRTGRLAWYGSVDEAYEFFGKKSMEQILLSINQKEEGGEGKADEYISAYAMRVQEKAG